MPNDKPWINPSAELEREWNERRLAALASTQNRVKAVLALPTKEARRQYLADYRKKWGRVCAEALEAMVRKAWGRRRA